MNLNIRIEMDNAAFGETEGERLAEAARILREAADELVQRGLVQRSLRDLNGNTTGSYHFSALNKKRTNK